MRETHEDVKVYMDEHGDVHSTTAPGADEATIRIPTWVRNPEAQVKSWPAHLTVLKIRPVKQTAAALAALAEQQKMMQTATDGTTEKKAARDIDGDAKAMWKRWAHLLSRVAQCTSCCTARS